MYQEVNLCQNLSVAENIFIGRQPRRFGKIQWSRMRRRSAEILAQLELTLDVTARLGSCSLAMQQMVAIARAVDISAKVSFSTNQPSSLDSAEVAQLFRVIRRLRDSGVAVRSSRISRPGVRDRRPDDRAAQRSRVGEYQVSELPQVELVSKMIGKEIETWRRSTSRPGGPWCGTMTRRCWQRTRSAAGGRSRRSASPSTPEKSWAWPACSVRAAPNWPGCCSGQTRAITADCASAAGWPASQPAQRRRPPPGVLLEDRRQEGLVTDLTVRENIVLALQAVRGWSRPIPRRLQDELVERYLTALNIRPAIRNCELATSAAATSRK